MKPTPLKTHASELPTVIESGDREEWESRYIQDTTSFPLRKQSDGSHVSDGSLCPAQLPLDFSIIGRSSCFQMKNLFLRQKEKAGVGRRRNGSNLSISKSSDMFKKLHVGVVLIHRTKNDPKFLAMVRKTVRL